jgi:hypothetical protein
MLLVLCIFVLLLTRLFFAVKSYFDEFSIWSDSDNGSVNLRIYVCMYIYPLQYVTCHVTHPLIPWPANYFSLIISCFYFRNSVKRFVLIHVSEVCLFLIYHIYFFSLLFFPFCLSYHIFQEFLMGNLNFTSNFSLWSSCWFFMF